MARISNRFPGKSYRRQVGTGLISSGLLLLLFLLPASSAFAQTTPRVFNFEATIISQADGQPIAQDCLRFSEDGLFRADVLSSAGFPDGLWNGAGGPDGLVISAFMSVLATTETGQPLPFTVSFGGLLDGTGSTIEAVLVQSDGFRAAVLATAVERCQVPTSTRKSEGQLRGYDLN
jgi:hypothetical protein